MPVYRERLSICVSAASFSFGFEGGICDLIVLVPNHCISFYFDINFEQVMHFTEH